MFKLPISMLKRTFDHGNISGEGFVPTLLLRLGWKGMLGPFLLHIQLADKFPSGRINHNDIQAMGQGLRFYGYQFHPCI